MDTKPSSWKRTARQLQVAVLIAVVFTLGVFFGSQYTISLAQNNRLELPAEARAAFEPLYETFNLIQQQYIDDVDTDTLVDGAIKGMVEALGDQYSGYVDPVNFPFIDDNLSGEIEGIGVVISQIEDTGEIEVVNVLPNTPAARAGLREGDIFVRVNEEDVIGLTYLELAARVRGPSGSFVDLVMRRNQELMEFSIERARIDIPNVEYEVLEDDIAYIKMAQFNVTSRSRVDAAIAAMDVNSLNGLIFDLRGNPGGLLSTATEIAGLFLEEGTILVEEFGDGDERIFKVQNGVVLEIFSNGDERVYTRNAGHSGVTVPVVVLVDGRSASASELVAGAWQDNGTVTLVGATTFGKGTVQIQNSLVNGGGVRLTVARWLTPNREWIANLGVTPDIVVEIPEDVELEEEEDPQLDAALQFLQQLADTRVAETE